MPPDGPARIVLDLEGCDVRPPATGTLAQDLATVGALLSSWVGVGVAISVAAGPTTLDGLAGVFVFGPAAMTTLVLPATRRLLLRFAGVSRLRVTPTELVLGPARRIPLARVRQIRVDADGELLVWSDAGMERIVLVADEPQTVWLAQAIGAAARRARRVPELPDRPPELERLREGPRRLE